MLCCHYIVLCTVVLGLKTISEQPYRIDMNKISYWNHVQSECGLMPLQYVGICFVSRCLSQCIFRAKEGGKGKTGLRLPHQSLAVPTSDLVYSPTPKKCTITAFNF